MDLTGERVVGGEVVGVRRAGPADEEFLRSLFMDTKAAELGLDSLPPELREGLLGQQWVARAAGYAHDFPGAVQYVAVDRDGPIGQLLVDRREDVAVRIVDISVVAAARGRGIGAGLLAVASTAAAAQNLPLRLSVATGNPAIRLYQRSGFVVVNETDMTLELEWKADPTIDQA
jgi:GNAT superfamily N-acetyltransferase